MTLPDSVVNMLWIVDNITLSGNSWPCDCDFRINTLPILTNRSLIVFDFNNSICHNSSVQNCNITAPEAVLFENSVHITIVIIATIACCILFMIFTLPFLYYRYKMNLCWKSSHNNIEKPHKNGIVLKPLLQNKWYHYLCFRSVGRGAIDVISVCRGGGPRRIHADF